MAGTSILDSGLSNALGNVLYHSVKSLQALFYNSIAFALSDVEASNI
jgi:hypothetical protein